MLDPDIYAKVVIARFGGRAPFYEIHERRHRALVEAWEPDSHRIGRVVRSHLFVEHYLSRFLESQSRGWASLESARLSFAQKLSLVRNDHPSLGPLKPGIARLNVIRNRIAHTLKADVREEDLKVFRGIGIFMAMRRAGGDERIQSNDSLAVLESFAQFAGMLLEAASAPDSPLWSAEVTDEEVRAVLSSGA